MKVRAEHNHLTMLARWVLLALVIGTAGAVIVALFNGLLGLTIDRSSLILTGAPFLLPITAALLEGGLILRYVPGAGGEGIPSYILAINRARGKMSYLEALLKFPATILTLGMGGSGGIVGPLAQMGAGAGSFIAYKIFRPLRIYSEDTPRTAAICGVSGAISAIFHSPLGGGLFAAEVLKRESMRYRDLFPAVMTGCISYIVSAFVLGEAPVFSVQAPPGHPGGAVYAWMPLVALLAGGTGMLFIFGFESVTRILSRIPGRQPVRALTAGGVLATVWILGGSEVLRTSMPLFGRITGGNLSEISVPALQGQSFAYILLLVILLKILTTSFTVGSGMSAGFTGPLLLLGAGVGALSSILTGSVTGSVEYHAFMACGISGIMGATLNIPIAASVLAIGIFGPEYTLPSFTGGIIAFLVFRSRTIYTYFNDDLPAVPDREAAAPSAGAGRIIEKEERSAGGNSGPPRDIKVNSATEEDR